MNTNVIKSTFTTSKTFWLIIGIACLTIVLKDLPIINLFFGPFQQFETMLHEMSHALACVFTGGTVSALTIVEDGNGHGGLTFTHGGIPFIYSQAGYIGETLWGCLLIALSRFPKLSRYLLMAIGVSMAFVTLWFMPGGLFIPGGFLQALGSIVWGVAMAGALYWCGKKMSAGYAHFALLFIAVQSCLSSLQGMWVLLLQSFGAFPGTWSDATNMAQMTSIPAWFWGIIWSTFSVVMLSWTLYMTFKAEHPEFQAGKEKGKSKSNDGAIAASKATAIGSSAPPQNSSDIETELLLLQESAKFDQGVKIKTTQKQADKQRKPKSK